MKILRGHPGIFDFYENDIDMKIMNEQRKERDVTLNKLMCKHVSIGDGSTLCSFGELRKSLSLQCENAENIVHSTNDFLDNLYVTINGTEFSLSMPLFPKGNEKRQIEIRIERHRIITRISTKSTPDSIVNYLVGISEWIPEYAAIEERIRTEEEKKRIACKIAFDALEKIVEDKLKDKGYTYTIKNQGYTNSAFLRIRSGSSIYMKIEIRLLDDFLERITAILDSLPVFVADQTSDVITDSDVKELDNDNGSNPDGLFENGGFDDEFDDGFFDHNLIF